MTQDHPAPATPGTALDLLFVAAHPDDELLACGALMRAADAGRRVGLLTLSCGAHERDILGVGERELPGVRCAEVLAAGRLIGLKYVRVLRYDHARRDRRRPQGAPARTRAWIGGLQDHLQDLQGDILAELLRHRPARVVTFGTDGYDGHPDHVAAHHATLAALAHAASDLKCDVEFISSDRPAHPDVTTDWRPPTRAEDVSDLLHRKLRVMSVYRSAALGILDVFLANAERALVTEYFRAYDAPTREEHDVRTRGAGGLLN